MRPPLHHLDHHSMEQQHQRVAPWAVMCRKLVAAPPCPPLLGAQPRGPLLAPPADLTATLTMLTLVVVVRLSVGCPQRRLVDEKARPTKAAVATTMTQQLRACPENSGGAAGVLLASFSAAAAAVAVVVCFRKTLGMIRRVHLQGTTIPSRAPAIAIAIVRTVQIQLQTAAAAAAVRRLLALLCLGVAAVSSEVRARRNQPLLLLLRVPHRCRQHLHFLPRQLRLRLTAQPFRLSSPKRANELCVRMRLNGSCFVYHQYLVLIRFIRHVRNRPRLRYEKQIP